MFYYAHVLSLHPIKLFYEILLLNIDKTDPPIWSPPGQSPTKDASLLKSPAFDLDLNPHFLCAYIITLSCETLSQCDAWILTKLSLKLVTLKTEVKLKTYCKFIIIG